VGIFEQLSSALSDPWTDKNVPDDRQKDVGAGRPMAPSTSPVGRLPKAPSLEADGPAEENRVLLEWSGVDPDQIDRIESLHSQRATMKNLADVALAEGDMEDAARLMREVDAIDERLFVMNWEHELGDVQDAHSDAWGLERRALKRRQGDLAGLYAAAEQEGDLDAMERYSEKEAAVAAQIADLELAGEGDEAFQAQSAFEDDYARVREPRPLGESFEDMPAHMMPYMRDAGDGIDDPFLQMVARNNMEMSMALGRFNGSAKYWMNYVMSVQGGFADAASATGLAAGLPRMVKPPGASSLGPRMHTSEELMEIVERQYGPIPMRSAGPAHMMEAGDTLPELLAPSFRTLAPGQEIGVLAGYSPAQSENVARALRTAGVDDFSGLDRALLNELRQIDEAFKAKNVGEALDTLDALPLMDAESKLTFEKVLASAHGISNLDAYRNVVDRASKLPTVREGFTRVYRGSGAARRPQLAKSQYGKPHEEIPSGSEHFMMTDEAQLHIGAGHEDAVSVSLDLSAGQIYGKDVIAYDVPNSVLAKLPDGDHALREKVFKYSIPDEWRVGIVHTPAPAKAE
jgi:hypothetical protein